MNTTVTAPDATQDEQFEKIAAWAKEKKIDTGEPPVAAPPPPANARPLGELVRPSQGDPNELLRHRYLCRGGGLLLVGPTGIGKSSLSMQFMLLWALGREAFGIAPARPLKSLLIQAENDDGDLAEMRDGVRSGLGLKEEEARAAFANIIVCREDSLMSDEFFKDRVIPLLKEYQPDLLWIDPVLAYLGGEANSQKDVGRFLRNQLNPVLNATGAIRPRLAPVCRPRLRPGIQAPLPASDQSKLCLRDPLAISLLQTIPLLRLRLIQPRAAMLHPRLDIIAATPGAVGRATCAA